MAVFPAATNTGRFINGGIYHLKLAYGDGAFHFYDAALREAGVSFGADTLLDDSDTFYDSQAFLGEDSDHPTHFTPVIAGEDFDLISGFDVEFRCTLATLLLEDNLFHRTSGANETIFMKPLSRSSRATGPKIREPRGSPSALMMTAALSSNRMYVPLGRR